MRDYEELVKRLREEAREADTFKLMEDLFEAADAIEELSKPKWISVEDAPPKNELETYWVYTSVGSQHSCRWTNNRFGLGASDKWGWSVFDIPQYTNITHWMPLPEPPKEEIK